MTRHGDTCGLCADPILDVNELVVPSKWPFNLPDVEPDTAHRDCANRAVAEVEEARRGDEAAYAQAMGWTDEWGDWV